MIPKIVFILVEPAREENVGAAARAMKIMNIPELRLVAPLCDHLGERARATAHASNDILDNSMVFESLEAAREDISMLVGSAAKRRTVGEDVHLVENLPALISAKGQTVKSVAVAFGGEESGLSNSHLRQCDMLSTIPMYRKYPSLNLGQAVMVYATYLSKLTMSYASKKQPDVAEAELPVIRTKALQVLADVGMDPDGIIHRRIMERLMLMGKDDLNLFHSFCKFYLKKYHGRIK